MEKDNDFLNNQELNIVEGDLDYIQHTIEMSEDNIQQLATIKKIRQDYLDSKITGEQALDLAYALLKK